MRFPPVILALPGMLLSGRVISSRGYNKEERDRLEEAPQTSFEALEEGAKSIAGPLKQVFPEPTSDAIEAIQEDYEPQTIYLVDVRIVVGDGVTELSGIAVDLNQVLGWTLGGLSD